MAHGKEVPESEGAEWSLKCMLSNCQPGSGSGKTVYFRVLAFVVYK